MRYTRSPHRIMLKRIKEINHQENLDVDEGIFEGIG
jgi:hypothetical protein